MTETQSGLRKSSPERSRRIDIILLAIIFAAGCFLRLPPATFERGGSLHGLAHIHPQPAYTRLGFDEDLYRVYVEGLSKGGLGAYPEIVDEYIEHQKTLTGSILPPVRFLYIFAGYVWRSVFGCDAMTALQQVAAFFSMLTLCFVALFTWRLRGPLWSLGVTALFAVAPTQLHMSQHALVDGFFTFWATVVLGLLWGNLRRPNNWRWIIGYLVALALVVLTKENSAFVWFGCVVLILANRWFQFGIVTRELVIATVLGPLLGVVVLIFLAGGIDVFVQSYQLSVSKNFQLRYAVLTGDGPWYRYLVDLFLVSPIVLILAFGTLFRLNRTMKPEHFMAIFIAASYLVMCNVKYGMNLRYANMWDLPLRFLAFSQILALASFTKRYRAAIVAGAVV